MQFLIVDLLLAGVINALPDQLVLIAVNAAYCVLELVAMLCVQWCGQRA